MKLMIMVSDNTATNFLVNLIEGKGHTINARLKSLGTVLLFVFFHLVLFVSIHTGKSFSVYFIPFS
jgi:beta-lactamase class A